MSTHAKQFYLARSGLCALVGLATCLALSVAPPAAAQSTAEYRPVTRAAPSGDLEALVGPIALYPDDLVAIILPASTFPLQLVQAERFLERRKTDTRLALDDDWDDSVKSLVNYPDIVRRMSQDLDWTTNLGEAVVADQAGVLDAVQQFRRKAQAAGNLKSDTKQNIVVESEVIRIVPADPQVIYVPQYNPATVVAYSPVPVYGYYPSAYPVYYYPYAPGAAFATGLIWGAAIGAAWNGSHYGTHWEGGHNNITVNRNVNRNVSRSDINRVQSQRTQATAWRSDKRPGQVSSGGGRTASSGRWNTARPGDVGGGARGSAFRPADTPGAGRGSTVRSGDAAGGARTQTPRADYADRSRAGGAQGRDALGGYGSGRVARADSSRGAASRSSMANYGGGRPSYGASSYGGRGGAGASGHGGRAGASGFSGGRGGYGGARRGGGGRRGR